MESSRLHRIKCSTRFPDESVSKNDLVRVTAHPARIGIEVFFDNGMSSARCFKIVFKKYSEKYQFHSFEK